MSVKDINLLIRHDYLVVRLIFGKYRTGTNNENIFNANRKRKILSLVCTLFFIYYLHRLHIDLLNTFYIFHMRNNIICIDK